MCDLSRHTVGEELAVEVPDGEAVGRGIELGVGVRLLPAQRVEVGDQVPAHPVHVDERLDVDLLLLAHPLGVAGVDVAPPPHRLVGHAHRAEHVVVEPVRPEQQLVDALEEEARLRPLDDAVVVGRRQRHHLGDTELGQHLRVGALVLGRVRERADADDEAPGRA